MGMAHMSTEGDMGGLGFLRASLHPAVVYPTLSPTLTWMGAISKRILASVGCGTDGRVPYCSGVPHSCSWTVVSEAVADGIDLCLIDENGSPDTEGSRVLATFRTS